MKLFVGNLSYDVTEEDLRGAFQPFGEVASVMIMRERHSDESRGFGFVEMHSKSDALAAMEELDSKEWKGRTLNVNEARPHPQIHQAGWNTGGGGKGGGRRKDSRRRGKKRRGGNRRNWNR